MSDESGAAAAASSSSDKKVDPKGVQYHCDYCRKDITNVIRIKCAECADFDLCVECFAAGAHVQPHRPDHDYKVVSHVKTPLFTHDWGADEELALLEAIEQFGMGNWSDVAEHVGTKNKKECEDHYDEIYLNSATAPLPDVSKALTRRNQKSDPNSMSDVKVESKDPSRSGKPPPRAHGMSKPKPKSGLGHLVGYIPNRGDFDTEWENDAELTLADMEFKDEDTKWERDLKLKVLEIYNSKLDARIERKKFILERGLLERKEKKRTKEEREVYNNMRVFARFHSAEEHEAFIQGLLNEQRLRKKIEQLQTYRLNGIRTLADGELFEVEKRKRDLPGGKKLVLTGGGISAAAASSSSGGVSWPEAPGSGSGKGKKRTADTSDDAQTLKKGKTPTSALATSTAASSSGGIDPSLNWDVTKMPGHELLSAQERLLCSTLQLLPQHYLMIKERLIRECFTRGFLKENAAKQLIKIDVNKTSKIFDFFVSVGWLTVDQPAATATTTTTTRPNGTAATSSSSSSAAPNTLAASSSRPAASSPAVKMQM